MQHTPAYTCDTLPSEAEPTPGTCFGQSSYCHDSYSAEIVAIIVGLLIAPPEGNTNIKCDNQGVTQVAPNLANRTRRAQLKTPFHDLYRVVTFLLSARTTEIDWVRAHVGIPSNEVADTLAKTAAQCIKHHTTDINPDALPLDALMALCCLPINISIYPRKITRVDGMHLTTDAINYRDSGTPAHGGYAKPLKALFHTNASKAYAKTTHRGSTAPFYDPTMCDLALWKRGLIGKILDPLNRHLESHIVKLAAHYHTSPATLDRKNTSWREKRAKDQFFSQHGLVEPTTGTSEATSAYMTLYNTQDRTCPACTQHLSFHEYTDTLTHLLTNCTHPPIVAAKEIAITNLGARLINMGAPNWATAKPKPSFEPTPAANPEHDSTEPNLWHLLTPPPPTSRRPPPPNPPVAAPPLEPTLAPASITLRVTGHREAKIASAYLHSYLTALHPNPHPTASELRLLPNRTTPATCSDVLHPSFTLAARELYDINTELFASPPYLSPHLTNHQLRSPHPHLATMTPSTWTETQRAIGITQVNDPLLHEAIQQAHRINTQDTSCTILIIIGALTPRVTLILAQYPPTETSHHMASSLPQPHVELLNGTQGSTIALSARLPEQCTILRFGHGPSILTFLNHRALQPLIPSHSTTPTKIAHANTVHKLIGNTFQWFAPALQPPQNQIAINGIPPQPQDAPANNDLPPPKRPPSPPQYPEIYPQGGK